MAGRDVELRKIEKQDPSPDFTVPEGYVSVWIANDEAGNPTTMGKKPDGTVVRIGGGGVSKEYVDGLVGNINTALDNINGEVI